MVSYKLLSAATLSLGSLPVALGYGAAGHEMIATVAQMHLHPSVLPAMCEILNFSSTNPNEPECHLAPIAAWADKHKWQMRWSSPLHYINALGDHPSDSCVFPGPRGWGGHEGGNVLAAIRNTTGILQDWVNEDVSTTAANEAFKFLVHFLGDLHQPLHLTGRDRGGNGAKVLFDGRQSKLHSVWDGLLIAKTLRSLGRNYSHPLPLDDIEYNLRGAIYDPYIRRVMWEGILRKWKDEIPSWLSCPAKTPASSPQDITLYQRLVNFFVGKLSSANPGDDTDDEFLCPYYWAQPMHELNCEIVWPKKLDEPPYSDSSFSFHVDDDDLYDHYRSAQDELSAVDSSGEYVGFAGQGPAGGPYLELDTPEYTGKIMDEWIVEKLIAKGGIRLAATLNWIFADVDKDEKPGLWIN